MPAPSHDPLKLFVKSVMPLVQDALCAVDAKAAEATVDAQAGSWRADRSSRGCPPWRAAGEDRVSCDDTTGARVDELDADRVRFVVDTVHALAHIRLNAGDDPHDVLLSVLESVEQHVVVWVDGCERGRAGDLHDADH